MSLILVVYASSHGHTAKVAAAIATVLREAGQEVPLRDVATAGRLQVTDHDAVVVGGSVHGGHHQRELVQWGRHHAAALTEVPSAFFSVCLAAADDSEEGRQAARDYVEDFIDETGWTPRRTASFAGALQYREYDAPTRLIMRLMMARGHHPTDVSHDHDYTDWAAVTRFARECVELVAGRTLGGAPA